MSIYKYIFGLFCILQTFVYGLAQNPHVESFKPANELNLSARISSRVAEDGKYCSLIRLSINNPDVKINGLTEGDVIFTDNIYEIFLHPNATSLTIEVPGYNKLFIDMTQYSEVYPLVEKHTYNLKISLPTLFSNESDKINYEKALQTNDNINRLVTLLKIKDKTPEIIRMMADCYLWSSSDQGVVGSYERYNALYRQAAELGDDEGCQHVGDTYRHNNDWANAVLWYEKGASSGNAYCMYRLGDIYCGRDDYGQEVDDEKAFLWYLRAAETSSDRHADSRTYAQCEVAECYYQGIGVDRDYDKAFFWYKKAAEPFDDGYRFGRALFFVGQCYEFGRGTEKNLQLAYKYYLDAEKEGEERLSNKQLGLWYLYGIYVSPNINKAIEYFTRASELFDSYSSNFLGEIFLEGKYGIAKDEKKAYDYFFKSFVNSSSTFNYHWDNYSIDAIYNLGRCCEYGLGCEQNYDSALSYYRIAKKMGLEKASEAIQRLESSNKQNQQL